MAQVTQVAHERMRFNVRSASGQGVHLVDLREDDGWGVCMCQDFQIRIQKNRREKKGRKFCRHLKMAFAFFGWQLAREIAKKDRRQ